MADIVTIEEVIIFLTLSLTTAAVLATFIYVAAADGIWPCLKLRRKRSSATSNEVSDNSQVQVDLGAHSEGVASQETVARSHILHDDEYDHDAEEIQLEELEHVVIDNGSRGTPRMGMGTLPANLLSYYTRFSLDRVPNRRRLSVYSITGYAADDEGYEAGEANSGRPNLSSPPSYRSRNASDDETVGRIAVATAGVDGEYPAREDRGVGNRTAAAPHDRNDETSWPLLKSESPAAAGRSLTDPPPRSFRARKPSFREDETSSGRSAPEHLRVSSCEDASDPILTPSTESEEEEEEEGDAVSHAASLSQEEALGPLPVPGVLVASGRSDADRRYTWSTGGLRQRWTIAYLERARRSM